MKGRADKRGASKPAKKGGGKAKGAPQNPATTLVDVMGQSRGFLNWTREHNLLMDDGEYVFRPLKEPPFSPSSRPLRVVARLDRVAGDWRLNGESLDLWLRLEAGPRLARKRGIPQTHATPAALWAGFVRGIDADLHPDWGRNYVLKTELQDLCEADALKVCAVAWFRCDDEVVGMDEAVLLCEFRQVEGRALRAVERPKTANPCAICNWSHDDNFTLLKNAKTEIRLAGVLSKIVKQVHASHEAGSASMEMKQVDCEGYRNPSNAFNCLGQSDDYRNIFATCRSSSSVRIGTIALRDAIPSLNKS